MSKFEFVTRKVGKTEFIYFSQLSDETHIYRVILFTNNVLTVFISCHVKMNRKMMLTFIHLYEQQVKPTNSSSQSSESRDC